MRITVNRGGKYLIPKDKIAEASVKLARYETIEEIDDVRDYTRQVMKAADELDKHQKYGYAEMMRHNAALIVKLNSFHGSAAGSLMRKSETVKEELLDYLDDIDGMPYDDPVNMIRQKVEELL